MNFIEFIEREDTYKDMVILNFPIEQSLLKRLTQFWHRNEFPSRIAAVRWLLAYALEQNPKVTEKE